MFLFCFFARLQTFMIVDYILSLLTSTVSESLGSYEKLPQAVVGGITLGGKDEGAFGWLVGTYHTSPLSL